MESSAPCIFMKKINSFGGLFGFGSVTTYFFADFEELLTMFLAEVFATILVIANGEEFVSGTGAIYSPKPPRLPSFSFLRHCSVDSVKLSSSSSTSYLCLSSYAMALYFCLCSSVSACHFSPAEDMEELDSAFWKHWNGFIGSTGPSFI